MNEYSLAKVQYIERHEGLASVSREGRSVGEFWLMTYQHLWLFLFYQLGDCK